MIRQYTVGCDPEIFLVDSQSAFVSAHDLIPGSKHMPMPVSAGYIQPDGTAAEFNIHPAHTKEEFSNNIRSVLYDLKNHIAEMNKNLELRVVPTAFFRPKYFRGLPASAKAFGCEPDYNAYTGKMNIFEPTKKPFRTGAGHIHIGWTENESIEDRAHMYDCTEAVKQLDAALFFTSLLWDPDETRRELYGKIGSFRPKPYGVEYRPLSNVWVADPDLHDFIFDTVVKAMELLDNAGTVIYENPEYAKVYDRYVTNRKPTRDTLLHLHETLTRVHGLPELPSKYLEG